MNLKEPFVIAVSREIGSGGHTVGQILADRLNIPYYDKYLIEVLEDRFNLSIDEIERRKGERKNWLADFFQHVTPFPSAKNMGADDRYTQEFKHDVTTDDIYKAETEILLELANEGSCVIAGRSGFHVFRNHPNRLSVFVTASEENRIKRVMRKQGLTEESAVALIGDIDKKRENYIKRYTGTSRYDVRNYDLVLNADGHSEEQLADIILTYLAE
ncbi:MAG: cytidylate kinase-like family protein [Bacteroidales bacterium]|nr:cytidylate kinase-like family protein [Bacteroidales bacterium]